jgi:Ser/Thr protein kinase RdoA (MazF antagonist)
VTNADAHPFDLLTPDFIMAGLESLGLSADGRLLALNSYENRVYQVGIEDATPVIVKFYRPGRWSYAAIAEEHAFAHELAQAEIPVVAPTIINGQSLFTRDEFLFAIYPRQGGRWPELVHSDDWQWLGRFLGRIHAIGRRGRFQHRPRLIDVSAAREARRYLRHNDWVPEHLHAAYDSITAALLSRMQNCWYEAGEVAAIRLHGDCHLGNLLWVAEQGPHFVDLDDCLSGPAVQDLWMLLSGSRAEQAAQLRDLLAGYSQFAEFDYRELALIETVRTLRQMNYAAWLARRWSDPAFPKAFPWFGEVRYWERHVLDLREQLAALDEPVLALWD